MNDKPSKDEWVQSAYDHLVRRAWKNSTPTPDEEKNLRHYTRGLAEDDDFGRSYFAEGLSPAEAVDKDLACAPGPFALLRALVRSFFQSK